MNMRVIVVSLAFASASPIALGVDCPGNQLTGQPLSNFLVGPGAGATGQLICAYKFDADPTNASRRWSEEHRLGGDLWEYARGPSDSVDPSRDAGSWSESGNVVTYTYDGDGTYERVVYRSGNDFYFCTNEATPQQDAIVFSTTDLPVSGSNPCGWP